MSFIKISVDNFSIFKKSALCYNRKIKISMKTHRFYIKDMGLEKDIIVNKKACPELYNQVVNVLRLQKAEHVKLFRESLDYVYEIKDITHDELTLILKDKIENRVDAALKSKSQVNLYIANIKKDKIEWCVEKATELGVASINLISTERAQKLNTQINSNKNNLNRLEKIIIEATEQCGRGELVKINESQKLEKAIQSIAESGRENIN